MSKAISETERARRRQLAINSRAALGLGVSLEACLTARKAAIEHWTGIIRGQMEERSVSDPAAVLPEILARGENAFRNLILNQRVAAERGSLMPPLGVPAPASLTSPSAF